MNSPLENLVATGDLQREASNDTEFNGLVASGRSRLHDASRANLAIESRFDLAYNASHALCLAALRHAGYRSNSRYMVFQTVPHTTGLGPGVWRVLAKCHGIRNQGEYEGFLNIDEKLVSELIAAATAVANAIDNFQ